MLKKITISLILFIGYYPIYARRGRMHDGRGPSDDSSGGILDTIGTIIFWIIVVAIAWGVIKTFFSNKDE